MGSSFVSLGGPEAQGFWMSDGFLEVWLRLLALHIDDEPQPNENKLTSRIRNQWLLASRGFFTGCIPHGMEEATSTTEGRAIVRAAITSLMKALSSTRSISCDSLNLLNIDGRFTRDFSASDLNEIGQAFLELLDGKFTKGAAGRLFVPRIDRDT